MYDDKYGIITYCDVSCCSSILATVTFDEFWWCILIMIWKVYIFINALKTLTKQQQFAPHRRKANLMLNVFYGVIILIWSAMYRLTPKLFWWNYLIVKIIGNEMYINMLLRSKASSCHQWMFPQFHGYPITCFVLNSFSSFPWFNINVFFIYE